MYTDESTDYEPITAYNAKLNSLICRQGTRETVNRYYTRLKGVIEVLEYHQCLGGGDDPGLVYYKMEQAGETIDEDKHISGESTYEAYKALAIERFWATVMIINADNHRFGRLKRELANAYVKGRNEYPTTILAAYKLLLKYQSQEDKEQLLTIAPTASSTDESDQEVNDEDNEDFLKKLAFTQVQEETNEH